MAEQRMIDDQRIDAHSLQIDARQLARKLLDQARDLQAAARTMKDDAREVLRSVGMDTNEVEAAIDGGEVNEHQVRSDD